MFLKLFLGSENRWTGGQFSLVRLLFGAYLAIHCAHLLPWGPEVFSSAGVLPSSASPLFKLFPSAFWFSDSPTFVTAVLVIATVLSVMLGLGVKVRWVAVVLWWLWASLFDRNPLISNPGLPYVGWMLLAIACLAPRPYGSWDGRGEADAGTGWRLPQPLHLAAWLVLAAGYSYSGYTKLSSPSWIDGTAFARVLESPLARGGSIGELLLALPSPLLSLLTWGTLWLELLFLPLALLARARPVIWAAMLSMHIGLITLVDFADLSLGMVMIHLFTFDPGWIRGLKQGTVEMLFYDGTCGLCHRAVRFVLSEDPRGEAFRIAPLRGAGFTSLPDSLVIRTDEGVLLTRSSAVIYLLKRLGGLWRVLGLLCGLVPRGAGDRLYDGVARARHRLFARPGDACPILPASLRARFDTGT